MEKNFWLERWEREEIGFHQNEINPYLRQYWQELHLARGSEVFVPLCGKSRDMLWLREQGHSVLGVELSAIAAQAFFKENDCAPQHVTGGKFERYETDGMRILCGDFFDLGKDDLAQVGAVYDRASLVALPPEMRERYARHLVSILPPATLGFGVASRTGFAPCALIMSSIRPRLAVVSAWGTWRSISLPPNATNTRTGLCCSSSAGKRRRAPPLVSPLTPPLMTTHPV